MHVFKWDIRIFYADYDAMCCGRVVDFQELQRIIKVLDDAARLGVYVEYRVKLFFEEVDLDGSKL